MSDVSSLLYREEQPFRQVRLRVLLALPPLFFLFLLIWQVLLGHPWGKRPMSNGGVIFLFVVLLLVYARLVTVKLSILVSAQGIRAGLRGIWWKRRIPGGMIQSVKVVTYNAVRDYGGYGIRSSRLGRAYIAGGNRGVLLKLANQDQILLGSESPDELADAISRMRGADH